MQIRFALCAFRDYGDAVQHSVFPADGSFAADTDSLCAQIQDLAATGGGDGPEDLLGALNIAGQLRWSSRLKFVVVITDAPAHGRECTDDPSDRFKDGDPEGHSMASVMKPLRDKGIDLMFCRVKAESTNKTQSAMAAHYNNEEQGLSMKVVDMFNADVAEARRFHFLFCLDASSSMQGARWDALMNAFRAFLATRKNDQSFADLVTAVTFTRSAVLHYSLVPLSGASTQLAFTGGGTAFSKGLECCRAPLAQTPADCVPVMIFMSDGQDGTGDPVSIVSSFTRRPGFVCHCVSLEKASRSSGFPLLQRMAEAGRGTAMRSRVDTIESCFRDIAAGCSAMDGLVEEFGVKIAKMVSTTICLDHM